MRVFGLVYWSNVFFWSGLFWSYYSHTPRLNRYLAALLIIMRTGSKIDAQLRCAQFCTLWGDVKSWWWFEAQVTCTHIRLSALTHWPLLQLTVAVGGRRKSKQFRFSPFLHFLRIPQQFPFQDPVISRRRSRIMDFRDSQTILEFHFWRLLQPTRAQL